MITLNDKLQEVQAEVRRLRKRCEEKGIAVAPTEKSTAQTDRKG